MQNINRDQTTEIGVAAALMTRSHPGLDHDEIGIHVTRALAALQKGADIVPASDIVEETVRILGRSHARFPEVGAPTRMQRLQTLLTQAGELAGEIEREEGRAVHALLLSDSRNGTVSGVLAPTVTVYQPSGS